MPKDSAEFEKGKEAGIMKLETVMEPGMGYSVRELEKLTGRSYTRIRYKLGKLEEEGKAENKIIDHVTYWRLTTLAYLEGTTKPRKSTKKQRGPGRPSEWVV